MIFQDHQQLFDYIKKHQSVSAPFIAKREYNTELLALIDGKGFIEELVKKIEFVETDARIKARKKYSRNISDIFERLFQPIGNVFHSTGGSFNVDIDNEEEKKEYLRKLANLRDEKSLKQYVEADWLPLYHIDPNGLIFTEYTTKGDKPDVYPTYKSIQGIRHYVAKGQLLEVLLFEPIPNGNKKIWRVVDDLTDYTVIQEGNNYYVDKDKTFEHPFGQVPGLINSNIIDISTELRLSPIHKIIGATKEFANTQSVKSIYKIVQGHPDHWKVGSQCRTCHGRKHLKNEQGGKYECTDCGGVGNYESKDVTDLTIIPYPREGEVSVLPNPSGHVSTDLEFLNFSTEELIYLEKTIYQTMWGISQDPEKSETATGRFIDQQPMLNRLNKYSDVSEWVMWKIAEWTADVIVTQNNPDETVTSISLGRRYILEGADSLLSKYEESKKEQDNTVILDRSLNEYITSKYGNDPEQLRLQLIKAKGEPYVHLMVKEVFEYFGQDQAHKKAMYQNWFQSEDKTSLDESNIEERYNKWYEGNKLVIKKEDNE